MIKQQNIKKTDYQMSIKKNSLTESICWLFVVLCFVQQSNGSKSINKVHHSKGTRIIEIVVFLFELMYHCFTENAKNRANRQSRK